MILPQSQDGRRTSPDSHVLAADQTRPRDRHRGFQRLRQLPLENDVALGFSLPTPDAGRAFPRRLAAPLPELSARAIMDGR